MRVDMRLNSGASMESATSRQWHTYQAIRNFFVTILPLCLNGGPTSRKSDPPMSMPLGPPLLPSL